MSKQLQAALIREIRRHLLAMLNVMYPTPSRTGTLYRSCLTTFPEYDFSLYRKDMAYFIGKGWVEYADNAIGGFADFDQKYIVLSAAGKEIAEGTMDDDSLGDQ